MQKLTFEILEKMSHPKSIELLKNKNLYYKGKITSYYEYVKEKVNLIFKIGETQNEVQGYFVTTALALQGSFTNAVDSILKHNPEIKKIANEIYNMKTFKLESVKL